MITLFTLHCVILCEVLIYFVTMHYLILYVCIYIYIYVRYTINIFIRKHRT